MMTTVRSFKYAAAGIIAMLSSQQNARIHALATVIVCCAGFYFRISGPEWCWLVLAIMAVWTAEALNTALELLADATSPARSPLIGKAKDVAAGAVLISAIGSFIIGLIIFVPHILKIAHRE